MKQAAKVKPPGRRPRHSELSDELAEAISSGAFPVGGRFPTEQDLQERFGVGRHTVREALKTLTDRGLLVRKRKIGTTVVDDRPRSRHSHLISDIKDLLDFSGNTDLRIEYVGMVTPGEALGDYLFEVGGSPWLRIAGARFAGNDRAPLCWTEIFVPDEFPLDKNKIRGGGHTIYEYCIAEHGLTLTHVEQEISAGLLNERVARVLGARPGSAALIVVRRYFEQEGRLFEVSINTYSADRYSVKSLIRKKA